MTFLKIILLGLLLLVIGGAGAIALIDVPVEQKETTQTIKITDLK